MLTGGVPASPVRSAPVSDEGSKSSLPVSGYLNKRIIAYYSYSCCLFTGLILLQALVLITQEIFLHCTSYIVIPYQVQGNREGGLVCWPRLASRKGHSEKILAFC